MWLTPKSRGWDVMQVFVNSTTILTEPTQSECCVKVCKKSALEDQSGWIEVIKDVKRPFLNRWEAIRGLWNQNFV